MAQLISNVHLLLMMVIHVCAPYSLDLLLYLLWYGLLLGHLFRLRVHCRYWPIQIMWQILRQLFWVSKMFHLKSKFLLQWTLLWSPTLSLRHDVLIYQARNYCSHIYVHCTFFSGYLEESYQQMLFKLCYILKGYLTFECNCLCNRISDHMLNVVVQ